MSYYPDGLTAQAFDCATFSISDHALLAASDRHAKAMLAQLDKLLADAKAASAEINGDNPYVGSFDPLSDRALWWRCFVDRLQDARAEAHRLVHGESREDLAARIAALELVRRLRGQLEIGR